MNKQELIEAAAGKANLSKTDTGRVLEAIVDAITETLKKNSQVTLVGFGTFRVKKRNARNGRSPRTGKAIQIPAKNVASFSAGKALKDEINNQK